MHAMSQVSEVLNNKVDKPSAEEIARRSRMPAKKAQTFSRQLENAAPRENAAHSTMPSGPTAIKYTDTLAAVAAANEKEAAVKKRLDDKKNAALNRANDPVLDVPQVVYPALGQQYFPQAVQVDNEKALWQQQAETEAMYAAEVDREMADNTHPGMPVSSTRRLLEKQYRKEMKMKMSQDAQIGDSLYQQMYSGDLGLSQGQMDLAVLEASDATSRYTAEERTRAARGPAYGSPAAVGSPGGPGSLAQAREASMRLQQQLSDDASKGPDA